MTIEVITSWGDTAEALPDDPDPVGTMASAAVRLWDEAHAAGTQGNRPSMKIVHSTTVLEIGFTGWSIDRLRRLVAA